MPDYIELDGNFVTPHPYVHKDSRFYCFILKADKAKLKEVCDRWFNFGNNHLEIVPVSSKVIVSFSHYERAYSEAPPYPTQGCARYKEMIFSILVKPKQENNALDGVNLKPFYAFIPYIFLDNIIPIMSGVEIYGIPKRWGKIQFLKGGRDTFPDELPLKTESSKEYPDKIVGMVTGLKSYGANQVTKTQQIIEVSDLDFSNGSIGSLREMLNEILVNDDDLSALDSMLNLFTLSSALSWPNLSLPFISLKQFRDISDPSTCCYQSIVDFACSPSISQVGRIKNATIKFTPFEMFKINETLGLELEYKNVKGFWLDWSFTFGIGREIWK